MERVIMYRTRDSKEFDDAETARQHELELDAGDALTKILNSAFQSGRADALLKGIIINAAEVRDALNAFLRRMPNPNKGKKLKVAKAA